MDKIILTTGGTGGHIFPALATAQALRKNNPQIKILFIGSQYGPEAKLAARENLNFVGLPVRGFMGRGIKTIPAAFGLGLGFFEALAKIKNFAPQAIAGFGGYASFAPVLAGYFLRVPILLHEQNAIAGASNRILSRFAKKLCVSLPGTTGFCKETILTGNPVREAISSVKRISGRNTARLLVLGGSQGARGINDFMIRVAPMLLKTNVEIMHQTGEKDFARVSREYENAGIHNIHVTAFIDDMAKAYEWADLSFCRSGASTIAELCACALPAVFVPFPAAIHDHQTFNAQNLVNAGAAVLAPENTLDEKITGCLILKLLADRKKLDAMGQSAAKLAKPDAAQILARELEKIAKK